MNFRISHFLYPLLIGLLGCVTIENSAALQINVKLSDGFGIKQVAKDELATNIFCMSSNPRGDIFVSGPGYIRRLNDADQDGIFESATSFANFPKSGAQGLFCDEQFILAVGDEGVWRLDDVNQDGIADGPPQRLLQIGTGGEHLAHAIRRGPDGWFYLIAGNATPIKPEYSAGPFSPVKHPRAGFLMRFSPDLKTQEVVAHGFRNAYDFAFNSAGQIFVYDSDGERDISLPWYRPTRVFQIQAGDDAGYVTEGWKRPGYYFDMPTEIGSLGRGSPTGVECYSAKQFGPDYADAVFVADWTFGRVMVFKRDPSTSGYDRGHEFAIATGQFGFAVTDLVVDQDGSLLVSVGGRGTAGALYRISNVQSDSQNSRVFAVQDSPPALLRRREAWNQAELLQVIGWLDRRNDLLSLAALESLVGRTELFSGDDESQLLAERLRENLTPFDPQRARLILRILTEMPVAFIERIESNDLPVPSLRLVELSLARDPESIQKFVREIVNTLGTVPDVQLTVCRLGQLAAGEAQADSGPEMLHGYVSGNNFKSDADSKPDVDGALRSAIALSEKREPSVTTEIARLAAMLQCGDGDFQSLLLNRISETSSPVSDIHYLNCLARTGTVDQDALQQAVAEALINVDRKIAAEKLPTDRNWIPRMRELSEALFQQTPELATKVVELMEGRESQSFIFDALPAELKPDAIAKFARAIEGDWSQVSEAQLRIVANSNLPIYHPLLRRAAQLSGLKETAIESLAKNPNQTDRSLYHAGLNSWDSETVRRSAQALLKLSKDENPAVLLLAFKAAQRLAWERPDTAARDEVMLLLQASTGQTMGYEFKRPKLEQRGPLEKWRKYLQESYPDQMQSLSTSDVSINVEDMIKQVDPAAGDVVRGEQLFRDLKCAQCHEGNSALGPRLEGVTKRFDRADLYRAIVDPSREISERYRATIVETVDGLIYKGTVIYESVDGLTLQDINGQTIRINTVDIQSKTLSQTSLMPAHLMDEVQPQKWADLESFLRTK